MSCQNKRIFGMAPISHLITFGAFCACVVISLVLAAVDQQNLDMVPSTMHIFSRGSRIICERLNATSFDNRFDLMSCDVTTEAGLATECIIMTVPPQNVSINWLLV